MGAYSVTLAALLATERIRPGQQIAACAVLSAADYAVLSDYGLEHWLHWCADAVRAGLLKIAADGSIQPYTGV